MEGNQGKYEKSTIIHTYKTAIMKSIILYTNFKKKIKILFKTWFQFGRKDGDLKEIIFHD